MRNFIGQRAALRGRDGLIAQALYDWSIILATWLALYMASPNFFVFVPLYLLSLLILAGRFHALGVVLHDAIHSAEIFRRQSRWLAIIAGYPIATTPEAMRFHHLCHHRSFGTLGDPYRKDGPAWKAWIVTSLKGGLLVFAWSVRPFVGLAVQLTRKLESLSLAEKLLRVYARGFLQAESLDRKTRDEVEACLRAETGQAIFLIAISGLTSFQSAWMVAAYWLPLWLAGFINVWRVYLEHDQSFHRVGELGSDDAGESGPLRGQVWQATRSLALNRWVRPFRWFLAPRNIGYHQAHHLFPTARQQDLPRIHFEWHSDQSARALEIKRGIIHDPVFGVPVFENTERAATEATRRDPSDNALVP